MVLYREYTKMILYFFSLFQTISSNETVAAQTFQIGGAAILKVNFVFQIDCEVHAVKKISSEENDGSFEGR